MRDVLAAESGGAVRAELCSAYALGGVTPSDGMLREALRQRKTIDVNVLIRPREGDFLYDESEISVMKEDILRCREAGADGVAVGAMTPEGDVDMPALAVMMDAAKSPHCGLKPLSVTFHRAFDVCRDPYSALESVISAGCDRILTSGCRATAPEGADIIAELVVRSAGRIIIMPGCGVRPANIAELERMTGAEEFHSSARSRKDGGMVFRSPFVSFSACGEEEHQYSMVSPETVRALASL